MSSGCISCLLFQRVSWFLFYYYFFSFPMPLLGHLSHSAERETEEKEEEAEPSAWHRILGPYCLLWSSSTSQASPGPWRGDASRPQSSLWGVDFLPTATFPRGLCLLVAAPLLPGMAGDAGAGVWKPGPASPPGAPRQGLEQTSDSCGADAISLAGAHGSQPALVL